MNFKKRSIHIPFKIKTLNHIYPILQIQKINQENFRIEKKKLKKYLSMILVMNFHLLIKNKKLAYNKLIKY